MLFYTITLCSILFPGSDRYCIDKKDSRFEAMCCHALGGLSCGKETQVGEEECKSLFGTYELSIPINKELECQKNGGEVTDENCKDFKVGVTKGNSLVDK